jgi:ketosteroid isomerase-like protein
MTSSVPAAVQQLLDAVNAQDTDAFLAVFTADGAVDDWGREFRGHEAVRTWSDRELIGVQATLSEVEVTQPGNPLTIRAQVGGKGFNGPSHFSFQVRDELVETMTIRA